MGCPFLSDFWPKWDCFSSELCRKAPSFSHGDIWRNGSIASDRQLLYNIFIKYKSNHNVVYSCKYHVACCLKYRRKVLADGVYIRLKELINETCGEVRIDSIEMEIMSDHVHLLLEVVPQYGIHKAVKAIKGRTSRILRQEFKSSKFCFPSLWTNSYFVSTVGGAPLAMIKQYMENQKHV